jgi:cytochrome c oxidase cbb3-type subunit 2
MPAYPWLERTAVDGALVERKMKTLRTLGHPYSDEEIAGAASAVEGKTELDALVAYLQGLGILMRERQRAMAAAQQAAEASRTAQAAPAPGVTADGSGR